MIDSEYFWWIISFLALGTLGIRSSIIAISHKVKITERHRELFSFIPACILPALLAPMVFFHKGHVNWLLGKERLFVLILSTAVCFYSRNTLATFAFGLICLYAITQI